jgi:hypothetical protein
MNGDLQDRNASQTRRWSLSNWGAEDLWTWWWYEASQCRVRDLNPDQLPWIITVVAASDVDVFFTRFKIFENSNVDWLLRLNSEKPPEFRPCTSVVMNNANNLQSKRDRSVQEQIECQRRNHWITSNGIKSWTLIFTKMQSVLKLGLHVWRKCHWMRDKACQIWATWTVAEAWDEPNLQPRGLIPIRRNQ